MAVTVALPISTLTCGLIWGWWGALAGLAGALLAVVISLLVLGFWHSRGGVWRALLGQFTPIVRLDRAAAISGGGGQPPLEVEACLDLEHPLARVDERFLSFCIDLSQVVGGRWWNPRADRAEARSGTLPATPFDFNRPLLDRLTAALAPAYLRIGGSEADKVWYHLHTETSPPVPLGFESILTRTRFDEAAAFACRNGLRMVFTLNAGPAERDRRGRWQMHNAARLVDYAHTSGAPVDVWELGNEVNIFFAVHRFGAQIMPGQYVVDLFKARAMLDRLAPGALLAAQGSAFWPVQGEPLGFFFGFYPHILQQAATCVDLFGWHFYPQQSRRALFALRRAHPGRLLNPYNLDEAAFWANRLNEWRDAYAPGKPIWLSETGNAQNGGEPGVSDVYISGLWWLDELGLAARAGHAVVARQTLCGSDYGLLEEGTLAPRPDYWSSLLWKRLMGGQVFGVSAGGTDRVRLYAQSTPGCGGAVTLLAINLHPRRAARIRVPAVTNRAGLVYGLSAPDVLGKTVLLNGQELRLGEDGSLPDLRSVPLPAGEALQLRPLSLAFVVFKPVYNPST